LAIAYATALSKPLPFAGSLSSKYDRWGALLEKGSPLTKCVSQAIDDLRESGQLQALQQRWMGSAAGAPVLK
jgi:polar amino acid transport system substrate-binding protein